MGDGNPLISGTNSILIDRIDLVFSYYQYDSNDMTSFFGNEAVDFIRVQDSTNNADPPPSVYILTGSSPHLSVTQGSHFLIYGTSGTNEISLDIGAKAELINFPGYNQIHIASSSDLFTVSRSGTVVIFQGSDGTSLKIPATTSVQTVDFSDGMSITLSIHNGQVMLDDQVVTTTPAPIEKNQVTSEGLIKSAVSYDAAPVYSDADQAAMVSGFSEFSVDFYHALRTEPSNAGKNFFFSAYSIENALAMTWAGAKNQTADQMADVLHLNLPQNQFHPTLNALNIDINSRDDQQPPSGDPFALNLVNAVWSRIGYPFVQDYLDVIAANYDAGIRTLDFIGDPDGSRQTINQWVEDQTNEKIQDLLPPDSITSSTTVVLTNAIYFKGSWYEKFEVDRTAPGPFTLLDGTVVTAELMHRETDTRYFKGSSFDAVELPYASPEFSEYEYPQELAMLLIIPGSGMFESVENILDKTGIDQTVHVWLWYNLCIRCRNRRVLLCFPVKGFRHIQ
jgi:serine protease inhibitor